MLPGVEILGRRLLHRHLVQADVDADAIEPRRQRRAAAKILQATERAEKHVLRQIARVLVVAHEPVAELIDRAAVPLDKQVESALASGKAGLDELLFVEI